VVVVSWVAGMFGGLNTTFMGGGWLCGGWCANVVVMGRVLAWS